MQHFAGNFSKAVLWAAVIFSIFFTVAIMVLMLIAPTDGSQLFDYLLLFAGLFNGLLWGVLLRTKYRMGG